MSCCRRGSPGPRGKCCATSVEPARLPAAASAAGRLLAALCLSALAACSLVREPGPSAPSARPANTVAATPGSADAGPGRLLLARAERQLGAPYRFGGASPQGFDCSGLVRWVHGEAGITVPRTAAGQQLEARPVPVGELQAGDLVFFRIAGRAVDHVGIYAGDGRFLHAPRSGRTVGYDRLDDPWWSSRQAGAGRFWVPAARPSAAPATGSSEAAPDLPLDGRARDSHIQP